MGARLAIVFDGKDSPRPSSAGSGGGGSGGGGYWRHGSGDGTELSIGRTPDNDLVLPKGNVSKRHARLVFEAGQYVVTDLNSTNGTYVNRRRINVPTVVRPGDRIYIGDFALRIE